MEVNTFSPIFQKGIDWSIGSRKGGLFYGKNGGTGENGGSGNRGVAAGAGVRALELSTSQSAPSH